MAGWMVDSNDPARNEIVRRALALGITGSPDKASHNLGEISLADGKQVTAHVIHAVDPIITDGESVVMINRSREPGKGKPALPGGFIDPSKGGGVESAVQAAAREAVEEVDITLQGGTLVGTRNMDRPFDVRVADFSYITDAEKKAREEDEFKEKYGIKPGDVFMVSTQAVRFDVTNLKDTKLEAGDDAMSGSARLVNISTLTEDSVGIPDHFRMIKEALPSHFTEHTTWRTAVQPTQGGTPGGTRGVR